MTADDLEEGERQRAEVWTRVMGYHRPVSAWNPGKQAEHRERVFFRERPLSHNGPAGGVIDVGYADGQGARLGDHPSIPGA